MGELAAEIGSCYVSAQLGIPQGEGLGNHAAYLRSWLEALKNDRSYIFRASRQASKVTDFLLGFVKKPEAAFCALTRRSRATFFRLKKTLGKDAHQIGTAQAAMGLG